MPNEDTLLWLSSKDQKRLVLSKDTLTPENVSMLLAEYQALREEIVKRIEMMHQIYALALIAPGTIFAYAIQNQNASLLLLYPILASCLAATWSTNDKIIRRIALYIRTKIESRIGEDIMGWEHSIRKQNLVGLSDSLVGGIFFITECLAIILGVTVAIKSSPIVPLPLLLTVAVLSIIITASILLQSLLSMKKEGFFKFFKPYTNRSRM